MSPRSLAPTRPQTSSTLPSDEVNSQKVAKALEKLKNAEEKAALKIERLKQEADSKKEQRMLKELDTEENLKRVERLQVCALR